MSFVLVSFFVTAGFYRKKKSVLAQAGGLLDNLAFTTIFWFG